MMTPAVDTEIAETLQWLRTTMESGTDFLADQAPLYVGELLEYGVVLNTTWLWLSGVFAVASFVVLVLIVVKYFQDDMEPIDLVGCLLFLSPVLIPSFIGVAVTLTELRKIEHAPRVYIMEHLKP